MNAPVGHVVGQGGKCWCGKMHAEYSAASPDMVWVNRAEYNSLRECMIEAADEIQRLRAASPEPAQYLVRLLRDLQGHIAGELGERLDAVIDKFRATPLPGPAESPDFAELKELPKLRVLANMVTESPCFTNAILAVTNAYREGWNARATRSPEPPTQGVFSRPECPFNYCDTKAPHTECLKGCRHVEPDRGMDRPVDDNRAPEQADNAEATEGNGRTCPRCGTSWDANVENCPEYPATIELGP